MKALKSFALGLAATLSLNSPQPAVAAPASGFHASSAPAVHASGGFHAPAGLSHTGHAFAGPHYSTVHSSGGTAKAPTIAFGGHPTEPPAGATARSQASNGGSHRPTSGWDRNWDRIWHGRHFHWNNGAWVIINDGYYPWDDSYYLPSSADVYPDMSYDYGDTPSDAGAPNYPTANASAGSATPAQEDSIAADVQQSLASRGYYDGHIDGIVGDTTREAIADFQKDNNLPITGYITKSLLSALGL